MKRHAIPLLAAALLFSGAAHADESFDSFRNFCVAGRGDPAIALTTADAAGWMPVPQQFLAQLPQAQFQDPQGRMRTAAGGAALLLTGRGTMPEAGAVRVCAVGVIPGAASDLAGQLQAFAGVPKQEVANLPEGFYVWREVNGAHVSVDHNTPDFRTQFASGAAIIATTRSAQQMTMVMLMTVAP